MPRASVTACLLLACTLRASAQVPLQPAVEPAIETLVPAPLPLSVQALRDVARLAAQPEVLHTVTWSGRITDPDGQPLAGVDVWMLLDGATCQALGLPANERVVHAGLYGGPPYWFDDMPLERLPHALTDARGQFRIEAPFVPSRVTDDEIRHGVDLSLVVRREGYATRVDPLLAPESDEVELPERMLEPDGGLAGVVVGEDGEPLAGVRVRLHAVIGRPARIPEPYYSFATVVGELVEASTDAQGRFALRGVWPGTATVELSHEGFMRLESGRIAVEAGAVTDAGRLVLHPGARITGVVVDSDGRPLAGARVHATSREIVDFGNGCSKWEFQAGDDTLPRELMVRYWADVVHANTAPDGSFVLAGVPDAKQTLYAMAPGCEAARLRGVSPDAHGLRLVLPREARQRVQITDAASHEPIADARLLAERVEQVVEQDGRRSSRNSVPLVAQPAEDGAVGEWVVSGVGPKATRLVVWAPGHAPQELLLAGLRAGEDAETDVALVPFVALSGHVSDAAGELLAGATVHLVEVGPFFEPLFLGTTDVDGAFEFPALSVGNWELSAKADGYAQQILPATVWSAERATELDFRLERGATLQGVVTDEDGVPVVHAPVYLEQHGADGWQRVHKTPFLVFAVGTDATGGFAFHDVPAGAYRLAAPHTEPAPVIVAPGEQRTVSFTRAVARTLTGRVEDRGAPVAGAIVNGWFHGLTGEALVLPRQVTDANGAFRLELPGPGLAGLTVRVLQPGQTPSDDLEPRGYLQVAEPRIDISDIAPAPVLITVSRGRIEGVWRESEHVAGRPGRWLNIYRDNDYLGAVSSGIGGRFAFDGLQAGAYEITLRKSPWFDGPERRSAPLQLAEDQVLSDVTLLLADAPR